MLREASDSVAADLTERQSDLGAAEGGTQTIVLDSLLSVWEFRGTLVSPRRLQQARVTVDSSVFPHVDADFEERLNEIYADCGCTGGSLALTGSALLLAAQQMRSAQAPNTRRVVRQLALLGIAATGGKVAGMAVNRARMLGMTRALAPKRKP
jgi:glycerol uptake facilitator-like aquaporin